MRSTVPQAPPLAALFLALLCIPSSAQAADRLTPEAEKAVLALRQWVEKGRLDRARDVIPDLELEHELAPDNGEIASYLALAYLCSIGKADHMEMADKAQAAARKAVQLGAPARFLVGLSPGNKKPQTDMPGLVRGELRLTQEDLTFTPQRGSEPWSSPKAAITGYGFYEKAGRGAFYITSGRLQYYFRPATFTAVDGDLLFLLVKEFWGIREGGSK